MRLIENLQRRLAAEQSVLQMQILREDIVRLGKMRELALTATDATAFQQTALRLGWTAGDLRTHEIRDPLQALAGALYDYEAGAQSAEQEDRIEQAWVFLHRVRMERLMGCLSTPMPKPIA